MSDDVLREFTRWTGYPKRDPAYDSLTNWYDTDAMAAEIARLREENETLRSKVEGYQLIAKLRKAKVTPPGEP